jgi:hypothetical protein
MAAKIQFKLTKCVRRNVSSGEGTAFQNTDNLTIREKKTIWLEISNPISMVTQIVSFAKTIL